MAPIFPGQIAVVNVHGTSGIQATEATEETVTVSPQRQQSKQRTRTGSAYSAHSVVWIALLSPSSLMTPEAEGGLK